MRSASLDLTWYQYFLLDVIAVMALAMFLVFLMLRALMRILLRCKRSQQQESITLLEKKES
jgi:hypothetical protein